METLYPASYMADSDWFLQGSQSTLSTEWTKEENKKFESALALFDEKTPDRWRKVAAMIPGKTVIDVIKQYQDLEEDVCDIESGRYPIPGYLTSSFTLDLGDDRNSDGNRKRPSAVRGGSDQERKKGVPWTEDEHRRFLMGLMKYGKGDWRNISRNFVVSKTPTQVASHAQKYFMRQHSGGKDKRRPSIHDITTVNLTTSAATTPSETNRPPASSDHSPPLDQKSSTETPKGSFLDWNAPDDGMATVFGAAGGNLFEESSPFEWQKLYTSAHYAAHARPSSSMYVMQSSRHQIHG